jgi:two-component system, chemotaxis family, protein-glutamate methylesterase/glutaminase
MQQENETIKVIVIDDSAFMRKSLTLMLESDPEIQVIATARDGREGIDKISKMKPDIVTLDIEMPGMNGLTALKFIMEQMPLPVLIVSSLTTESALTTMQAFDLGAVDFISKDLSTGSTNIKNIRKELIEKIKQITRSRLIQTRFRMKRLVQSTRDKKKVNIKPNVLQSSYRDLMSNFQAVVMGLSTGGPQVLLKIIPSLSDCFPLGIGIAQHMPPHFTRTLADRLNSISKVFVKEAEHGEAFEPGKVLIAPGGKQMTFSNNGHCVTTVITESTVDTLYHPSVDMMMLSAAEEFQGPLLGLIMTGMGKDGSKGLKRIKSKGGYVIAQDEESCVIFGMPQAAIEEGSVDSVMSPANISATFDQLTKFWTKKRVQMSREGNV